MPDSLLTESSGLEKTRPGKIATHLIIYPFISSKSAGYARIPQPDLVENFLLGYKILHKGDSGIFTSACAKETRR